MTSQPVALTHRFDQALHYAAQVHGGHVRKGTTIPYISHLMMVSAIVLEFGGDEDEAIAALLHDAVEDMGGKPRLRDIQGRFGPRVAAIVEGCTDTDVVPKPPYRARKEAYIAHLSEASASIRLVSAADKLANVRSILKDYRAMGEDLWARFNGGRDGTLWYYGALAKAFNELGPAGVAAELSLAVAELDRLTRQEAAGV